MLAQALCSTLVSMTEQACYSSIICMIMSFYRSKPLEPEYSSWLPPSLQYNGRLGRHQVVACVIIPVWICTVYTRNSCHQRCCKWRLWSSWPGITYLNRHVHLFLYVEHALHTVDIQLTTNEKLQLKNLSY